MLKKIKKSYTLTHPVTCHLSRLKMANPYPSTVKTTHTTQINVYVCLVTLSRNFKFKFSYFILRKTEF